MNDGAPEPAAPASGRRAAWALDAGLAAFAATTGALMAFGYARDGMLVAFTRVGRRVARDIALPGWGDAAIGLAVHAGQCLALGAAAALLLGAGRFQSRVRAALVVVFAWELAARIPWLAVVRADVAMGLPSWPRAALALLLVAALAVAPRSANSGANSSPDSITHR